MNPRGGGILLHITSLPSPYGIGDLGKSAFRFVDFLAEGAQTFWQILPAGPTSISQGNSPYGTESAFAGNPLLISPDILLDEGLVLKSDLAAKPLFPVNRVDFPRVTSFKKDLLRQAFGRFRARPEYGTEFREFLGRHAHWLEDYALFRALKGTHKESGWMEWGKALRNRDRGSIRRHREKLKDRILFEQFLQFVFFKQWNSLRSYCGQRGVQIIGDLPIYVQYDSSDVWAHPELFKLDEAKRPNAVAGVPPDYFSATGQRWGYPLYDWERHKATRYDWWVRRFAHNLGLYDWVRVDHFRGFAGYWEIPATEPDAVKGRWMKGPSEDFLEALHERFPLLPIIAEDLGVITPDVRDLMRRFEIPGMKILLFAFDEEDVNSHPYAPHNFPENCVVYTGTHDNNTIRGWLEKEATSAVRERVSRYLGHEIDPGRIHRDLIRLTMSSVARTAIIPMQDLLGLGEEARMNRPATGNGNWEWRFSEENLSPDIREWFADLTRKTGRASGG